MILLTFNIKSFEVPTEKQGLFTIKELDEISVKGTESILRLLQKEELQATFFIESRFGKRNPELVQSIAEMNYGISLFYNEDTTDLLEEQKTELEQLCGKRIIGIRYLNEDKIDPAKLKALDIIYDSSFQPRSIKDYLKKITRKTTQYEQDGILYLPISQSPMTRLPFSDLSFQALPLKYYEGMIIETLNQDDYALLYYYPWQFMNIRDDKYGLPFYRKYNLGDKMYHKFAEFLQWINEKEYATASLREYFF